MCVECGRLIHCKQKGDGMRSFTEKQQRMKSLKDLALSMVSAFQSYESGELNDEELYDWLEIDAQHIMKRIDKFRELTL